MLKVYIIPDLFYYFVQHQCLFSHDFKRLAYLGPYTSGNSFKRFFFRNHWNFNFPFSMTNQLHIHPLFQIRAELLSPEESIALSYQRARIFLRAHSR